MKPHLRRAKAAYPYYKLAVWDPRSLTFRDGKTAYPSLESAVEASNDGQGGGTGRYRVSIIREDGREDLWPHLNSEVFSAIDPSISGAVCGYDSDGLETLIQDENGRIHCVPTADLEISGGGMAPCP